MDELTRDLEDVRRYAATLSGVLADAAAKVPDRAVGEDSTGAVTVVLDAAGLPAEIDIASDWQRRLEPGRLGSAVTDAAGRATDARVAQWGRSLDGRGIREVDELKEADATGRPLPTVEPPPVTLPPAPPGPPRPADVLTEDALRTLDASIAFANRVAAPADVTAANRDGTVHVSLTPSGLSGCTIDAAWVNGKAGPVVAAAVRAAVSAARARLASVEPEPSPAGEIDSLFGELMALFGSQRMDGMARR